MLLSYSCLVVSLLRGDVKSADCSIVCSVDAAVLVVVMPAVAVYSSDCWYSLLCRCYTSMDHIDFVGHTESYH